ncbi:S-adenosyl-L-methionine-dependent methyltransferase [Cladochytrium replicatum]|nr:S-adenosyl-L-methionine-dependent methyltransferase [Cladochytrium replicatum]
MSSSATSSSTALISDVAPLQDPTKDEFLSRLGVKNRKAADHKTTVDSYYAGWDADRSNLENSEEGVKIRRGKSRELTNNFYNMVTDFYEYGWGESFHFGRMFKKFTFDHNIARHEDFLALALSLKQGQKVLDVGCGVGGPAREIASFSGATVVGVNNNQYQVDRLHVLAEKEGLSKIVSAVKGDYLQLPFGDASFDAAYAVEACVHAPKLEMVYGEVFRVLKPGGLFANYEWVTTPKYDESNQEWKRIIHDLEEGNSIAKLYTTEQCIQALKTVGFEVIEYRDLADDDSDIDGSAILPWYSPLEGKFPGDNMRNFRMSPFGRQITDVFVAAVEALRIAPPGTRKVSQLLNLAADRLVAAGELKIFTPMFFYVARKPLTSK